MRHSIRWRLSLSFAAIALLAALALGAVLLITLRGYYARRELDYLASNAKSISADLSAMIGSDLPPDALQGQIENLAFLTQTRVRLLDENGKVLQDSGVPTKTDLALGMMKRSFTAVLAADKPPADYVALISLDPLVTETVMQVVTETVTMNAPGVFETQSVKEEPRTVIAFRTMRAVGTPYGFDLDAEAATDGRRSNQVVRQPFYNAAGKLLGYVELSEGPAYGRDILDSVAVGWAVAGAVAVLLATAVGWLVSRRLTAPLLALTDATQRMAAGDLAARAAVASKDEMGLLAHSFNEMADRVEGTIVALRQFVSDAAHQIHTPLTALHTNLELAEGASAPGDRQRYLGRAQAQVERLEWLTDGLLVLSRIEAHNAHERRELVEIAALAHELAEAQASRAEQAGLAFALDLSGAPLRVAGCKWQLQVLLDNLVDNAIKFTAAGGSVAMGARSEGGWVELWVEDTGIGVPPEELPLLFGRFHRGRNAAAYPGSGLGLAIVKAVAESHGGRVAARNTAAGTRFTVRLPAAGA